MQGATDGKDGQLVRTYTAQQRQQQKQKQKQQAGGGGAKQQQGKRPPKQRLKQLKQAYEEGLIDGDAYNVAQRALAAEIAGVSFTTKCVVRHTDGTVIETSSSSAAAAAAATPARGGGAAGRAVPAHDMEATIARLSTGREDVRVHDEAVVEYCIDRLLETNDGVSPATVCPIISRAAV